MAPLTWPEIRPRIIHARAANTIGAASKRSAAAGTVRVASMPGMVRQSLVHFLGYQWTSIRGAYLQHDFTVWYSFRNPEEPRSAQCIRAPEQPTQRTAWAFHFR